MCIAFPFELMSQQIPILSKSGRSRWYVAVSFATVTEKRYWEVWFAEVKAQRLWRWLSAVDSGHCPDGDPGLHLPRFPSVLSSKTQSTTFLDIPQSVKAGPDSGKRWRGVWKRWLLVGSDRSRNALKQHPNTYRSSPALHTACPGASMEPLPRTEVTATWSTASRIVRPKYKTNILFFVQVCTSMAFSNTFYFVSSPW